MNQEQTTHDSELPELGVGDVITILVSPDERGTNDLWWWDGMRGKVAAIHEGRYRVITSDGYHGWFARHQLASPADRHRGQSDDSRQPRCPHRLGLAGCGGADRGGQNR